jgi:16S rRNA (adenine(1408)-N(1))-methyltransferase
VVIDLGTGDGRAVLAAASREPRSLVLGIDANAASMAEASRRAARPAAKGGLPNAIFIASAVESAPVVFDGTADLVTVLYPWGSLLRGVLGLDPPVARAIARLPRLGGTLRLVLSVTERDGLTEVPRLDARAVADIATRLGVCGLDVVEAREATAADLAETQSTWAKRLLARGAEAQRPVWRLEFKRLDAQSAPDLGDGTGIPMSRRQ